ncbi:MAG: glycosyltransferase family 2 protein [Patescibacteria group bacterium]|nr:glycosyltransferase family 2 protein [Patescibacteria group bacterium]MDE2438863.1 glycosyltransferase family 2 protein [Patescibacteria group bacterium]
MKISVVIPAHNEEARIKNVLNAVLIQDYPDFEVIVVDNASTDNTAAIVRSFNDIRLQLIHEPRKGLPFAREAGRLAATGDILAQLDADCLPETWWISRAVDKLSRSPHLVSISGPYLYYDYDFIKKYTLTFLQFLSQGIILNFFGQLLNMGGFVLGGNAFIRKSVLDAAGGYNTNISFYGEDTETARRISKFGHTGYTMQLYCNSSARRFKHIGFFKMGYLYCKTVVFVFINNKILEKKIDGSDDFR